MDVQCEKCGTEYALDETLVGRSGTAVRCTKCGHVFRVYNPQSEDGSNETWTLRQVGGATFPFDRLGVLQDWIAQGKVSEDDLLSKSGGQWKRLGDIAEMKPFFDAVRARGATGAPPVGAGYAAAQPSDHQATIRQAPAGGSATQPQHSAPTVIAGTAEYPAPQVGDGRQSAPMARPAVPSVVSQSPTLRVSSPLSLETQPQPAQPQQTQLQQTQLGYRGSMPATTQPAPAPVSPQTPTAHMPAAAMQATQPSGGAPAATHQQKPTSPGVPSALASQVTARNLDSPRAQGSPYRPIPGADRLDERVRSEPDLSQVPSSEDDGRWERGAGVQAEGPAWAEREAPMPQADEDFGYERPVRERRIGRWIALVVVVAILGGGFYVFMFHRDLVRGLLAGVLSSAEEDRHATFFLKGRESFLLDTDDAFREADREYQKVLALRENHPPTLAALAEMYAVWAQYLRDAYLEARADAEESAGEGGAGDFREAERLERDRDEKIAEAERWAEQAVAADPDLPAAHLAMADVKRLEGDLDAARKHLEKARAAGATPETRYVGALLDMDSAASPGEVARSLRGVSGSDPFLRALYREARVLAAAGEAKEAGGVLDRLFDLNSDHPWGRGLARRIDAGKPIPMLASAKAPPRPDAGVEADAGAAEEAPEEQFESPVATAAAGGQPAAAGGAAPGGFAGVGGSVDSMLVRATKLQENGRTGEAISLFEAVLQRAPSNVDALSGLAYCYLDRGSYGMAISHFRRALGSNGSYGPAMIGLAETYKAQGQKAQALKWFSAYAENHPTGRYASMARRNAKELEDALASSGGAPEPSGEGETPPAGDGPEGAAPSGEAPPAPSGGGDEGVEVKREIVEVPPPDAPTSDAPAVGTEPPGLPPITEE